MHRGGNENPVVFAMSTSYTLVALLGLLGLAYAVFRLVLTRKRTVARRPRWDGGVRRLLPEMTYTATGFSNPVRVVFDAIFRPTTVEDTKQAVAGHFRTAIRRTREEIHLVDRLVLGPLVSAAMGIANGLARMHHGKLNAYVGYVLLTLVVMLVAAWFW